MEQKGYIKLHRILLNNPIIQKPAYISVWITLLLLANHQETSFIWNGKIIIIKEGQCLTGRKKLCRITGVPEATIERILNYLENEHQIEQQKSTKWRLITIINWNKYQHNDNKMDNRRTTDGQQTDTYKNVKNVKNVKNTNSVSEQSSLTLTPKEEAEEFFKNDELQEKAKNYAVSKGIPPEEIDKFILYWTEPTKSGKKQKWETKKTFEVKRRLLKWFENHRKFNQNKWQII